MMVTSLIRGKQFNRNRVQGKYWRIILDGTGLFCFKERHCANCLCTTRKMEDVEKQDCELNAAKRLLARIKKDYPRLPILLQGDALYAVEPIMKLCREKYHWEYLFTQKDTRQKQVNEGYEWIKSGEDCVRQKGLCQEKGSGFFANHVEEVAGKREVMNVFEYEYEKRIRTENYIRSGSSG